MKEFWNERYSATEYAYGIEPNKFFSGVLAGLKPGKILFPAEGEGRNAVYAAEEGWEVSAFDLSEEGKKKADQLAASRGVTLDFQAGNLSEISYPSESFDTLVLIFAHFPADLRESYHRKLLTFLKPGGMLVLEGFSKDHLKFSSVNPLAGGPKDTTMLFSEEELRSDFHEMEILSLEEKEAELKEGLYHSGRSAVIRLVAMKLS